MRRPRSERLQARNSVSLRFSAISTRVKRQVLNSNLRGKSLPILNGQFIEPTIFDA